MSPQEGAGSPQPSQTPTTAETPRRGLLSMTGHGIGDAAVGDARLVVEIRSVNHRYLDIRTKLPPEILEHAPRVEEAVRRTLGRGRVEVVCRVDGVLSGGGSLHVARARAAYTQLVALRDEVAPDQPVPLSLLVSVPDLFVADRVDEPEAVVAALVRATEAACHEVARMREAEGRATAEDLGGQLHELTEHVEAVRARAPEVVAAYRERLRTRLSALLAERDVPLDEGRLEHEVALFADRADVAEELARLGSHAEQLREILATGGESSGKRIDFLLQEMSREVNTIGSKCANADLAQRVVEMKVTISRMREQAQNVL